MKTKRSAAARKATRTRMRTQPRTTRRGAAIRVLFRQPWGALLTKEIFQGSRQASRRRPAAERRRPARKAVRTGGRRPRRQAARRATRPRARG